MKSISIQITKEIPLYRIACLLCSALEGGSNYWYQIDQCIEPPKIDFQLDPDTVYKHIDYPLNEGGALIISDLEGEEDYSNKRLDLESIKKGLEVMANLEAD